jgi:hypothetical protein
MRIRAISLVVALMMSISPLVVSSPAAAQDDVRSNQFWWPENLNLSPLRDHDAASDPIGHDFNYAKAFANVDLVALKQDIAAVMTDSQDWWPADYGHYGPFGTARALIGPWMAEAAPRAVNFASSRSIAGQITRTWTRRDACCGQSSKSMAGPFHGPT